MADMQTAEPPSLNNHGSPDSYASASSALDEAAPPKSDDMRAIFEHFDANKDGRISQEEMSTSLQRLGLAVPPAELADLMAKADINADGFVNYEEFVGLYKALARGGNGSGGIDSDRGGGEDEGEANDDGDLKEAFGIFDKDGDGLISAQELHSVLKSMGVLQGRNLTDCVAMIHRVDSDGNGQVDFQEFKEMMSSSGSMP